MKKLLLLLLIFASGTALFCNLRNETVHLREIAANNQTATENQEQFITQMRGEREQLIQRIRAAKRQLASANGISKVPPFGAEISCTNGYQNFSPEQAEKLLAELGFNWNSGDYLIVSKKSLGKISLDGMKGVKLTEAARDVLAITPAEQATIEIMTRQLDAEHTDWVVAHAQREEPSGDVVAKYSLPFDAEFSQTRSNAFVSTIRDALGNERGELLQDYAYSWMQSAGMFDSQFPTADEKTKGAELTVTRRKSGDDWQIDFTMKQGNSSMMTTASPWQPFPEAFKPLFPGGWADLAAREGFELPKSFKKKKG